MIKITFPDKTIKEFKKGTTPFDIALSISEGLSRSVVAAKVNDQLVDVTFKIIEDSEINLIKINTKEGLEILRHSTAHVMASAVKKLWPDVLVTIGPAIEDGFYYDFDKKEPFKQEDLDLIEKEMKVLIKNKIPFIRKEVLIDEAKKILVNEKYKLELIDDFEEYGEKTVSLYELDNFIDLCKGPHLPNSGFIKAFKLLKTSSAYWRGDSSKQQLQRIYGVAFPDKKDLKEHLEILESAKNRDHVKLGKELDLFVVSDVVGKGLPLLTPKGATIKRLLRRWIEDEEIKRGYLYTDTPVMTKSELYKISGHYDHYKDGMFVFNSGGEEICLRPMTCPHQFMIYKSKTRSYRDLPLRYAEVASLFRKEQSGELHGLIRIKQFTLADAHIICMPSQIENEFEKVIELIQYVMTTLGLDDYWYRFSKWDPNHKGKYIDNPEAWESSQKQMKKILDKLNLDYDEADGEAAFYGPKLDIQMKNVWGKEDTIFTVQIDFAMPERFDMTYEGEDGQKHRPMIIHRSSIGCLERTMALLIEKYGGKFPLWLAPIQVKIITISDKFEPYAKKLGKELEKNNIRFEYDFKSETVGKKIREAQLMKINYQVVIGEKEQSNDSVNVRDMNNKIIGELSIKDFLKTLVDEINTKAIKTKF